MASQSCKLLAIFLAVNLMLFTIADATVCPPPVPRPTPRPTPRPRPIPTPRPAVPATCPIDVLKLGACANLLGGLLGVVIGTPPKAPCCSLIEGLADVEAAVCLCTAIRADILGIHLNVPVSLSVLLNVCSKRVPPGWTCP